MVQQGAVGDDGSNGTIGSNGNAGSTGKAGNNGYNTTGDYRAVKVITYMYRSVLKGHILVKKYDI